VAVSGPVKTVYIGGQNAVDAAGKVVGGTDVGLQTEQVLKNIDAVLAAAGARPEHIVKWNVLLVQGHDARPGFTAFQKWWGTRANPPAITVATVAGLANPEYLVEIDAIAVVPGS
jgi:enamine deaminase RidA (YjgF/YER057c/UK114 family)